MVLLKKVQKYTWEFQTCWHESDEANQRDSMSEDFWQAQLKKSLAVSFGVFILSKTLYFGTFYVN